MTPQRIIVGCWLAALVIIVWSQQESEQGAWPPAYRVGGAAVTYTALLVFAAVPGAGPLAAVFALSWTAGLAWRVAKPGAKIPTSFGPPAPVSAPTITTPKAATP